VKLVIDTVIVVRAFIEPASWSGTLLDAYRNDFELIASPAILAEYQDIANRPAIQRKYIASENQVRAGIMDRLTRATIVNPEIIPAICRYSGDDKFLAATLAGEADYPVSEDQDLLSLGEYEGIVICDSQALSDLHGTADAP
jgi:putative PIN family toxin of toxin-antitoxin system